MYKYIITARIQRKPFKTSFNKLYNNLSQSICCFTHLIFDINMRGLMPRRGPWNVRIQNWFCRETKAHPDKESTNKDRSNDQLFIGDSHHDQPLLLRSSTHWAEFYYAFNSFSLICEENIFEHQQLTYNNGFVKVPK